MTASPRCSNNELRDRSIALESDLRAFKELMEERDMRYAQRALAQDTAVAAALATSKEAVTKAEGATERRLETLNELRGVVVDQARDFARKTEVQLLVAALEKRIEDLAKSINVREAHGGGVKDATNWIIVAIGLGLTAAAIYFRAH